MNRIRSIKELRRGTKDCSVRRFDRFGMDADANTRWMCCISWKCRRKPFSDAPGRVRIVDMINSLYSLEVIDWDENLHVRRIL
jgi:hypothetical protein